MGLIVHICAIVHKIMHTCWAPGISDDKESAYNAGDLGLTPGWGKSPGKGNGNPLQYSCLEIPWTEESNGLQSMEVTRAVHDLWFQENVYLLEQFLAHSKHSELGSFLLGPVDNSPAATLIESVANDSCSLLSNIRNFICSPPWKIYWVSSKVSESD